MSSEEFREAVRGSDGQDGDHGPEGPPGAPAVLTPDDYTKIGRWIAENMPIQVEQLDKSGKVIASGEAYLGGTLKLYHDSDSNYVGN